MSDPTFEELFSREFNDYVMARFPGMIEPDAEDFDETIPVVMEREQANTYRLAIARKMIRLCREWKAVRVEKPAKTRHWRILAWRC